MTFIFDELVNEIFNDFEKNRITTFQKGMNKYRLINEDEYDIVPKKSFKKEQLKQSIEEHKKSIEKFENYLKEYKDTIDHLKTKLKEKEKQLAELE